MPVVTPTSSATATKNSWPVFTMDDILRIHREDTPSAPVPVWLIACSILPIALNIVLLFFYASKNNEAQARIDTASELLAAEKQKTVQIESQLAQVNSEKQTYETLAQLAVQYDELKKEWHTAQKVEEGSVNFRLQQIAQNYAAAVQNVKRRGRTLFQLLTATANVRIDQKKSDGKRAAAIAIVKKHQEYQGIRLNSIAIADNSALLIFSCKDAAGAPCYLKETLGYDGNSISKCHISTHQEKPEIPDNYSIYSL